VNKESDQDLKDIGKAKKKINVLNNQRNALIQEIDELFEDVFTGKKSVPTVFKQFKDYGGRGIKICDRWLESFENFYVDLDPKPSPKFMYSIDRIDNNDDYTLENCKWSTRLQQQNNRRNNKK